MVLQQRILGLFIKDLLQPNRAVISTNLRNTNHLFLSINANNFNSKVNVKCTMEAAKERYLTMPLEEKRGLYKANKFYQSSDILTWTAYFEENKGEYASEGGTQSSKSEFEIDAELNKKVAFWRGDITALEIDAIVNAANNSLLGGGGVDGAIHSAAGPDLLTECRILNGCDTGDAKIAGGYKLPAKHVILTVGPRGENAKKLESCYSRCLNVLLDNHLKTIAFPCISTGVYGYPNENAANVALRTVRTFLAKNRDKVDLVVFCLFLPEDVSIYKRLLHKFFPVD